MDSYNDFEVSVIEDELRRIEDVNLHWRTEFIDVLLGNRVNIIGMMSGIIRRMIRVRVYSWNHIHLQRFIKEEELVDWYTHFTAFRDYFSENFHRLFFRWIHSFFTLTWLDFYFTFTLWNAFLIFSQRPKDFNFSSDFSTLKREWLDKAIIRAIELN